MEYKKPSIKSDIKNFLILLNSILYAGTFISPLIFYDVNIAKTLLIVSFFVSELSAVFYNLRIKKYVSKIYPE
ncbi:MAG: hypothetical protein PHI86_00105 [Candidatus Omnitrophica bacterium]|nr:hypothetical protein [Candidatus Omnitrophota bacterium]